MLEGVELILLPDRVWYWCLNALNCGFRISPFESESTTCVWFRVVPSVVWCWCWCWCLVEMMFEMLFEVSCHFRSDRNFRGVCVFSNVAFCVEWLLIDEGRLEFDGSGLGSLINRLCVPKVASETWWVSFEIPDQDLCSDL